MAMVGGLICEIKIPVQELWLEMWEGGEELIALYQALTDLNCHDHSGFD